MKPRHEVAGRRSCRSILACCVAVLLLGCTSAPADYVDEDTASLLVVRGYFHSGRLRPFECGPLPPEMEGVVDCFSPPKSSAKFAIEEVFAGTATKKLVHLEFVLHVSEPSIKFGRDHQQLAVLITDGKSYEMKGYANVFRSDAGKWAIPITFAESQYLVPCSAEEIEPHRLRFRAPGPRESVKQLGLNKADVEDLAEDPDYTVRGGQIYPNFGVLLNDALVAYEGKSAAVVSGQCS